MPPATTEREVDESATAVDHLVATKHVTHGNAFIEARICAAEPGEGEWVTLLPGPGCSTADFTETSGSTLTTDLVEAGYRVVRIEPRGVGGSTGRRPFTMEELADDLKAVFDELGISGVHMVGHVLVGRRRPSRGGGTSRPTTRSTCWCEAVG